MQRPTATPSTLAAAGAWRAPLPAARCASPAPGGAAAAATAPYAGGPCAALRFPGPDEAVAPPQRRALIPTAPASGAAYQGALGAALAEEINLRLAEQARQFHTLAAAQQQAASLPAPSAVPSGTRPAVGAAQQQHQRGGAHGGLPADPAARLAAACQRTGLSYHPGSTLKVWRDISAFYTAAGRAGRGGGKRKGGGGGGGRRGGRRRGVGCDEGDDEDEGAGEEEGSPKTSTTLVLSGNIDRRKHRCA